MRIRKAVAWGLALALVGATLPSSVLAAGQQNVTLGGTAKHEAKKPYSDYSVRARNTQTGQIGATGMLDVNANFNMAGMPPANYVVELLNKDGKVVCSEGPYNMTQQFAKTDVNIDCDHVPAAWWLIGAAAAAGITAGVIAANASPSQ